MSKRGLNIYKRKDGRWEGRYIKEYADGKIKYGYVFGKTFKETKDKLLKHNIKPKAEDIHPTQSKNLTVKIAGEKWLNENKPYLKASSIVKYTNILNKYIYPKFGNYNLQEVTYKMVSDYNIELLNTGGQKRLGLAPKTVTAILSVLKNILKYNAQTENINVPDFSSINAKQTAEHMRILNSDEQIRLRNHLFSNLSLVNIGILMCMYMGLRIGEICALRWENILLLEQCIVVNATVQRLQQFDAQDTKTKIILSKPKSICSERKVPIPTELYGILIELNYPKESYLLTGTAKVMEPRTLQNRFKAIAKKCNIEDINFHALRHTFATCCVEAGVDVKSLSEILGHASVGITLNRYVHPTMDAKLKSINMLSNFLAVNLNRQHK